MGTVADVQDVLITARLVLRPVDEGNAASVAVVERLGMTHFDVVPGLLGPMIRFRRTASAR